jgi:hypothetical protein
VGALTTPKTVVLALTPILVIRIAKIVIAALRRKVFY